MHAIEFCNIFVEEKMQGLLSTSLFLVMIQLISGCGALPSRHEPQILDITQQRHVGRPDEFVFCDLSGGAWVCDSVTPKTAALTGVEQSLKRMPAYSIHRNPPETIKASSGVPVTTVYFNFNKANISDRSQELLINSVATLSSAKKITVTGYTDSIGSERYNGFLAQRRANAVKKALIDYGISPRRIHAIGRGACCYINTNQSDIGRAKNRRATVITQSLEVGAPLKSNP